MQRLIFMILVLFMSSCATGIPHSKMRLVREGDFIVEVEEKLGHDDLALCEEDFVGKRHIKYYCNVEDGPDMYLYISKRKYTVDKIKQASDPDFLSHLSFAAVMSSVNVPTEPTTKAVPASQPQQQIIIQQETAHENPFSHVETPSYEPKPVGPVNNLFGN